MKVTLPAVTRLLLPLTLIACFLSIANPALATGSGRVGTLAEGGALFWKGPQVASARVDEPSLCGLEGQCIKYTVMVTAAHAKVLRVALRTPDDSNGWEVAIYNPLGLLAADTSTYTLHGVAEDFDLGAWTHNPPPGLWTIEVVPSNVRDGTFQMRAALDPPIVWPASDPYLTTVRSSSLHRTCHSGKHGRTCVTHRVAKVRSIHRAGVFDVAPDLAADAPWHLTFQQPTPMVVVESGNFLALAGLHNTSASVADQPVYDCLPEETVQQGAHHCLRFTSGFSNLGPGRFEVYGSSSSPVAVNGGPLYQNVYRSDGSHYSRRAGFFTFHQIHAHYHVLGIAKFQLFPVIAPGRLGPPSDVLKEGFCLGDIKMYNWYSFAQTEASPTSPANCEPSMQSDGAGVSTRESIRAGRTHTNGRPPASSSTSSNSPDGLYLLRVTVNPYHYIKEADSGRDTNDVAYTYFRVTGDSIQQIERGHGTSPWDPHKTVENPVFGER